MLDDGASFTTADTSVIEPAGRSSESWPSALRRCSVATASVPYEKLASMEDSRRSILFGL